MSGGQDVIRIDKRTADCTIEHSMSRTMTTTVDSGTMAGSHVPVGECFIRGIPAGCLRGMDVGGG
jgi:hypothetical protein